MTPAELHDRALARTGEIVAAISPEQYTLPTPCPAFTVHDLLIHLIAGNRRFTVITRGEPATSVPLDVDLDGADPRAAYAQTSADVSAAWQDPALLDKSMALPFAEVSGGFALGIHTVEQVVHGWDLATATGQSTDIAPDLCDVAWAWSKDIDATFRGPNGPFGPAVTPPADASDAERLVAWLGRIP